MDTNSIIFESEDIDTHLASFFYFLLFIAISAYIYFSQNKIMLPIAAITFMLSFYYFMFSKFPIKITADENEITMTHGNLTTRVKYASITNTSISFSKQGYFFKIYTNNQGSIPIPILGIKNIKKLNTIIKQKIKLRKWN
jgi:hypothetical protein